MNVPHLSDQEDAQQERAINRHYNWRMAERLSNEFAARWGLDVPELNEITMSIYRLLNDLDDRYGS